MASIVCRNESEVQNADHSTILFLIWISIVIYILRILIFMPLGSPEHVILNSIPERIYPSYTIKPDNLGLEKARHSGQAFGLFAIPFPSDWG